MHDPLESTIEAIDVEEPAANETNGLTLWNLVSAVQDEADAIAMDQTEADHMVVGVLTGMMTRLRLACSISARAA